MRRDHNSSSIIQGCFRREAGLLNLRSKAALGRNDISANKATGALSCRFDLQATEDGAVLD